MYKSIIEGVDAVISKHANLEPAYHGMSESEAHYFIQGLEVAKQIVEQMQDLNTEELVYETLEEVMLSLKDRLEVDEVKELVSSVYSEEL